MRLEIPLTDKQSELHQALDMYDVTGYGGAKGGGKSHGARSVILLRSLTRAGHVGAIFRRSYPELEENHIGPLFKQFPRLRGYFNSSKRQLRFPWLESEFNFRYCKKQDDVDRYAGREYHTVGIEEAGDWPTEMAFKLLRNCNRSTVPGIRASALFAFNWGGIGHGGLKRIFWTKDLRENERKFKFHFILAKVEDNPAILEHDPGYLLRLESEPNEALRRAYRHGDPDIVAGQFFDLVRDVHVVKPFKIPPYWNWFGSYDYGYNHPAVWLFFAVDPDGRVYLVHEIVKAKMGLPAQVKEVQSFLKAKEKADEMRERARAELLFHAGHDCWAKKKGSDPTIAEDFLDEKVVGRGNTITLTRAKISRALGAHRVRQYLAFQDPPGGRRIGPNVQIFENCIYTIDCLTRMVHDPKHPEDVLKVDAIDGDPLTGDDPYDALRMGLMSRPTVDLPELPPPERGTPEWNALQEDRMEEEAEEQVKRQQAIARGEDEDDGGWGVAGEWE